MNSEKVILDLVREECRTIGLAYSPDVIINGPDGFYGEDAEDLIYSAAEKLGIPRQAIDRNFPYDDYFLPEETLSLLPLRLVTWLFGRAKRVKTPLPLTAQAFAILLVELHNKAEPEEKFMPKS